MDVLPKIFLFLSFHKDEIDNTVGIYVDKELWIEYILSADLLNWVVKLFKIS